MVFSSFTITTLHQASSQMSKVNLMLIIQGSLSLTPADMIGQLEDYLVAG